MKPKKEILSLIVFLSCLYACSSGDTINSYTATITVVDMHGQPLSNQTVNATGGGTLTPKNTKFNLNKITDANGRATFQYTLFLPSTAGAESATIKVVDDAFLKGINSCYHTGDTRSNAFSCTIQMDSFVPFKARIVRTDTNLVDLRFGGSWIETQNPLLLSQIFVRWEPKNIRTLDTTLTFLAWQKTPFHLWTELSNSPKTLIYKVDPQNFRDTAMLIRL